MKELRDVGETILYGRLFYKVSVLGKYEYKNRDIQVMSVVSKVRIVNRLNSK